MRATLHHMMAVVVIYDGVLTTKTILRPPMAKAARVRGRW